MPFLSVNFKCTKFAMQNILNQELTDLLTQLKHGNNESIRWKKQLIVNILPFLSLEWILRKNWMLEVEREQEVIKTVIWRELLGELKRAEAFVLLGFHLYIINPFFSFNSLCILQHSCYIYPYQIDTSTFFHLYQLILISRASIEPNFHDLYLKFLDKVNSKALNKEIVQATYENCKVWALLLFPAWLKWRCVKILK